MIDAGKIREAVQTLDPKDDTVWEADGTPKYELLKTLTGEPTLTVDDVEEALGPFKRGDKIKAVKPGSNKPAATVKAEPEAEVDLSKLDPQSPEYATAVVKKARVEDERLRVAIAAHEAEIEKHKDVVRKMTAERDVQIALIETYAPQITHAQAVKAIQQQTVKTLTATRERMATAVQILGPGGTPVTYASKLDASLGTRQRTPEQKANYAKFVHQSAAAGAV